MVKAKTSVMIEQDLWDELRHKAIDDKKDVSSLLEEAIKLLLKKK